MGQRCRHCGFLSNYLTRRQEKGIEGGGESAHRSLSPSANRPAQLVGATHPPQNRRLHPHCPPTRRGVPRGVAAPSPAFFVSKSTVPRLTQLQPGYCALVGTDPHRVLRGSVPGPPAPRRRRPRRAAERLLPQVRRTRRACVLAPGRELHSKVQCCGQEPQSCRTVAVLMTEIRPIRRVRVVAVFDVMTHRSHANVLLENFLRPFIHRAWRPLQYSTSYPQALSPLLAAWPIHLLHEQCSVP